MSIQKKFILEIIATFQASALVVLLVTLVKFPMSHKCVVVVKALATPVTLISSFHSIAPSLRDLKHPIDGAS